MGAGSSGAGAGRAGFDLPVVTPLVVVVTPVAIRYEGQTRDWAMDDAGVNFRSVTSTEQGMILSICINQNQLKSSPEVGNTLDQIVYLGGDTLQADVENRMRNSNPASALIAAGRAKFVKIVVLSDSYRLVVRAYFQALDTPNSQVLNRAWSN